MEKTRNRGGHLEDEAISCNHATIVYSSGDYLLRDNGSLHGTFVNGVRIKNQILCHNDRIRFGAYHFLVDLEGEYPESNLPASEPAHLDLNGQSYDRVIHVDSVPGHEEEGAMEVMLEQVPPPCGRRRENRLKRAI